MTFKTTTSAMALLVGAFVVCPTIADAASVSFAAGGNNGQVIGRDATFTAGSGQIQATAFPGGGANTRPRLTQVNQASTDIRGMGVCNSTEAGCYASSTGASQASPVALGSWSPNYEITSTVNTPNDYIRLRFVDVTSDGKFQLGSLQSTASGLVQWTPVGASNPVIVNFNGTDPDPSDGLARGTTDNPNAVLSKGADGIFTLDLLAVVGWNSGVSSCGLATTPPSVCTGELQFWAKAQPGLDLGDANNDYLLAGAGYGNGTSVIPVPAALPLFLSALTGLGLISRRKS